MGMVVAPLRTKFCVCVCVVQYYHNRSRPPRVRVHQRLPRVVLLWRLVLPVLNRLDLGGRLRLVDAGAFAAGLAHRRPPPAVVVVVGVDQCLLKHARGLYHGVAHDRPEPLWLILRPLMYHGVERGRVGDDAPPGGVVQGRGRDERCGGGRADGERVLRLHGDWAAKWRVLRVSVCVC